MRAREVQGIVLAPVGPSEYEGVHGGEDWHVRREGSGWVLTIFDANMTNADDAYLGSGRYRTLTAAVRGALAGEGIVTG